MAAIDPATHCKHLGRISDKCRNDLCETPGPPSHLEIFSGTAIKTIDGKQTLAQLIASIDAVANAPGAAWKYSNFC